MLVPNGTCSIFFQEVCHIDYSKIVLLNKPLGIFGYVNSFRNKTMDKIQIKEVNDFVLWVFVGSSEDLHKNSIVTLHNVYVADVFPQSGTKPLYEFGEDAYVFAVFAEGKSEWRSNLDECANCILRVHFEELSATMHPMFTQKRMYFLFYCLAIVHELLPENDEFLRYPGSVEIVGSCPRGLSCLADLNNIRHRWVQQHIDMSDSSISIHQDILQEINDAIHQKLTKTCGLISIRGSQSSPFMQAVILWHTHNKALQSNAA